LWDDAVSLGEVVQAFRLITLPPASGQGIPSATLFHYPLDEGNTRLRNVRVRLRKMAAVLAAVR